MKRVSYVGNRGPDGPQNVYVEEVEDGIVSRRRLDPRPRQKLWNHSPTGFEWGYGGSGPAQLALAILLDAALRLGYGPKTARRAAVQDHQDFKWKRIATLPRDGSWRIPLSDVEAYLL